MPHPESEHGLRVQLATALREVERLEGTLASAFGDLRESEKRADIAEEALAAARRECEDWRAVEAECDAVDCHCGCHVYAKERAALAAPGDGEEGK